MASLAAADDLDLVGELDVRWLIKDMAKSFAGRGEPLKRRQFSLHKNRDGLVLTSLFERDGLADQAK